MLGSAVSHLLPTRIFCAVSASIACIVTLASSINAGHLYVLNQINGAPNQIYCFSVNEFTGELIGCSGFPVSSGGNGSNSTHHESIVIDRANLRLYVLNRGSDTVSAFSINRSTQALTPLPFSPISIGSGNWSTISVHPTGSPLIVGDGDSTPQVLSIKITATTATVISVSANTTVRPFSAEFSRDGLFFYTGGLVGNSFSGYSINPATGAMSLLPTTPFDSGALMPNAYAVDSKGRVFAANYNQGEARVFTTSGGVLTPVSGNPFQTSLTETVDGALHPNERYYYISDRLANKVRAFNIDGEDASTTLSFLAEIASTGTLTAPLAFNQSGKFLFAANGDSRNLTAFEIDPSGVFTDRTTQPANTLGATGRLTGIAYLPTYYVVSNTNDSGAGSLRNAVAQAVNGGPVGGVIIFDSQVFSTPKTISLSSGPIVLDSNLMIVGPGAKVITVRNTAPPGALTRVFVVTPTSAQNPNPSVSLSGLAIRGAAVENSFTGGGGLIICGSCRATVTNCLISGNRAPSGGGILNLGTLNIINSTISENSAFSGSGGGIQNQGTLFITNTTISGNSSGLSSGGLYAQGDASDKVTIANSTITKNSAMIEAGGVSAAGTASVFVSSSIIAGNQNNASVPDIAAPIANFTSGGFNLIGNRGSATGFTQTGDQTGNGASPLDPKLVKVLSYKGGETPVHVPLPNSPAVDKGTRFGLITDQRLFVRPSDNSSIPNAADGSDIGAVERQLNLNPIFTAPFDFDGDNKTDISIFRPSVGEWWVNRSSTGATVAAQFGSGTDKLTPGDFTGDGKADIAFWRPSNGNWFVLRSEDSSFFSFPFGTNGDVPTPADFDGDAKTDAAVFRPSNGTWFILNSAGGNTITQFGSSGDVPVPGDYDGDGKFDTAIYRPSNGQWWLNQSTLGVVATTFGGGVDKAVQGDYTGDGKMDIAFWRPSTGEWFVLRSDDFSFFSFPFGVNGDIPAPGDYDGDGKSDAALYRPSNNLWFAQTATAGTLIQQFGSVGDQAVPSAFVP